MKKPLVSIIIVNYNAQKYLEKCLASIAKNTYSNYEVIVVDNGSDSFTLQESLLIPQPLGLKSKNPKGFPQQAFRLEIIPLKRNFGPAYARNRGAEKAKGKYLAFLDNDTEVEKNWLANAVEILEKDSSVGALQCKLLLNKKRDRFDYAGDYLTQWGFLAQAVEPNTKDGNQVPEGLEILAAKSAGMVVRKDVFKKIGGFDEDYFIYMEETDLCWRVWLSGKRVVFTNTSKVFHEFGTTAFINPSLGHKNAKYHGTKNYIATLSKNLSLKKLLRILPIHLALWFGIAFFLVLKRDFKGGIFVLCGICYNLFHLPDTLQKRKIVQKMRCVTDGKLFSKIYHPALLTYFIKKMTGRSERIGLAKGW
jgi:GT2 family glycosyltransferase